MSKFGKICDVMLLGGILCFLVVYPMLGKIKLDEKFQLNGVSAEVVRPESQIRGILDGSYQEEVENYLHNKISGKNLLVRIHNQILYSFFNVSSNDNVVIGKDKHLFEPEYINYSLNMYGQPSDEEIDILVSKLEALDQLLASEGKELYIFITPAKTRYYKDKIPAIYQEFDNSSDVNLAYDTFIAKIENSPLRYFDSINFIDTNKDQYDFPLFYSTGIHWSRALGNTVAEEFNNYLCAKSQYDLGHIEVTLQKTSECKAPDADLYHILNLLLPTQLEYYDVDFVTVPGSQQPSVFYRGGSFMGQSINSLILCRIFGDNIHFENNYYFTDYYSNAQTLSSFDAYEEFDVCGYLKNSDILILEVNEEKIFTMSWGFIDYILENYE